MNKTFAQHQAEDPHCSCADCLRAEEDRQSAQRERNRTITEVMVDWTGSRNRRRARVAREYWDDFQSGRPMGSDDY